ncbi:MAG: MBL fold metallo-hydrolase [Ignavibacteriales bacterium]|nr:MBL fold metallo-hydrolase [Ignavibacteriales bacterium]
MLLARVGDNRRDVPHSNRFDRDSRFITAGLAAGLLRALGPRPGTATPRVGGAGVDHARHRHAGARRLADAGPASAVVAGGRLFLVDAGAGVTRRLAAAGFPRTKQVDAVFLTHLHSDHTLGYPDLIFTTWIMGVGSRSPHGPPGVRRMTNAILDAWRDDVDERVKGLEQARRASGCAWTSAEIRTGRRL